MSEVGYMAHRQKMLHTPALLPFDRCTQAVHNLRANGRMRSAINIHAAGRI